MNKKIWVIIALPLIFGCQTLLPSTEVENPLQSTPRPAATTSTDSLPQTHSNDGEGFVINRINIENGGLLTQLATEVEKAKALGLSPFIEFDATWCPPCLAINASIDAKDPLTLKAFDGIYLIRADVDEWGWGDNKNFVFDAIPVYYKLDEQGLPTGDKVDGGAWNEDIPENFSPVLNAFFHGN